MDRMMLDGAMATTAAGAFGPYAAVFAPLTAEGRVEVVTRRLSDAIELGLLPGGTLLPSEADLADRLGVATATVREALGALREEHLIRTRRGRGGGSFVLAPADGGRAALMRRLAHLGSGEVRDLADHYAVINGACAALAAERADADDLAQLERLSAVGEDQDTATLRRAEANFHVQLAASAQSARLTRAELALQAEVGPLLWAAHLTDVPAEEAVQEPVETVPEPVTEPTPAGAEAPVEVVTGPHRRIVEAIARGDAEGARAEAEGHVREIFRSVLALHREARGTSH